MFRVSSERKFSRKNKKKCENFRLIFAFFREMFALFFLRIFYFAKISRIRLKQNFAKIFAFFVSKRNAIIKRNGSKIKFSRNDFPVHRGTFATWSDQDWIRYLRFFFKNLIIFSWGFSPKVPWGFWGGGVSETMDAIVRNKSFLNDDISHISDKGVKGTVVNRA